MVLILYLAQWRVNIYFWLVSGAVALILLFIVPFTIGTMTSSKQVSAAYNYHSLQTLKN
jgi:hypothetical protein